jgi:hypothetical protein
MAELFTRRRNTKRHDTWRPIVVVEVDSGLEEDMNNVYAFVDEACAHAACEPSSPSVLFKAHTTVRVVAATTEC